MKRPAVILTVGLLSACAAGPRATEVFARPADFVGQRIEICGVIRSEGLYPGGQRGPFRYLEVLGAPQSFYDAASEGESPYDGPACLTGTIVPLDIEIGTDDICIDYCASHGLVVDPDAIRL